MPHAMRMAVLSVFCALSALAVTGPAQPADSAQQRRGDQQEPFEARRNGRILPLRDIERWIVPAMKDSHYLGFGLDSASAICTLQFQRNGVEVCVDVDGRTGRNFGRTDRGAPAVGRITGRMPCTILLVEDKDTLGH